MKMIKPETSPLTTVFGFSVVMCLVVFFLPSPLPETVTWSLRAIVGVLSCLMLYVASSPVKG